MKKVAEDIWQIPLMPRDAINCYLVESFLIDAGIKSSAKKILLAIEGRDVDTHVITHAHADHQGSSKQICERKNIPLWCSEQEKRLMETGLVTKEYPFQNHPIACFQKYFWAGGAQNVTRTIKENDKLGQFTVVETPGHSSGHLSFFREKDGVLILGDVATNMNLLTTKRGLHLPPNLFTKDKKENIRSLKKLAALNPKILCFGHGPVLINKNKQFERFANQM